MQTTSSQSVSAVVVTYNRKDLLRQSLLSLMNQKDITLQTIVVDNGSTDGSVEMVSIEFPDVIIIQNDINRGFCAANNQGIEMATGDWVALLNNDAEAEPDWIMQMLTGAVLPQTGMVACKILVWEDSKRIDKTGHLIYWDGQNRGRGSGEMDQGQYDRMEEGLWPDGCAALYRRSMLEQIGGFDEDFFAYADDAELGLRARIAGWDCVYVPTAVVRHHRGATLGVRSIRRVELIERNRVLLAAKLFPWSLLWLNGVFYAARLAAGLWAAISGRGEISHYPGWKNKWMVAMAMIRADLEAFRMLPGMLRKRRNIRHLRKLKTIALLRLLWKHRISLTTLSQQSI